MLNALRMLPSVFVHIVRMMWVTDKGDWMVE